MNIFTKSIFRATPPLLRYTRSIFRHIRYIQLYPYPAYYEYLYEVQLPTLLRHIRHSVTPFRLPSPSYLTQPLLLSPYSIMSGYYVTVSSTPVSIT
jgi:hypothetical protein